MAKAKASENKDYKVGSPKKWLVAIGILVLIAIIVVIIVLCVPGNTYSAVERLRKASQTSFLRSQTEQANYTRFRQKIGATVTLGYYAIELEDIQTTVEATNKVIDFYDDYFVLATDNKTLSRNYKTIRNNFEDAQEAQEDMNGFIADGLNLQDNSETYLKNIYIDFRESYVDYISSMTKAIDALSNCYQGCFIDNLSNNLASTLILNSVDNYLTVITGDYAELVDKDVKGGNFDSYEYETTGKITAYSEFVDSYILNRQEIVEYNFTASLQDKYQTINSFFEVFSQTDFVSVIDSIDEELNITKTFEVEDSSGIYDTVKTFLIRG